MSACLNERELLPYLQLVRTEGIGSIRFHQLLKRYHTAEAALDALPSLKRSKDPTKKFHIPTKDSIKKEIEKTLACSGQFILHGTADYPASLNLLADAPPLLIAQGNIKLLQKRNVAIVGARNASFHGTRMAETLAADLCAHQIGVTSGLARGIDQAAHKGALYTGFTLAAIACGIDIAYPAEHKELQALIAQKGVVITEFPVGTQPQASHFPRRNRLIAGLSWGCVVIEAAQNSGSLITAKLALDYDRPVFAVPGSPLDPRCKGSNNLLRMGATLTESAADILPELPVSFTSLQETLFQNNQDLFTHANQTVPAASISNEITATPSQPAASLETHILSRLSTVPTPLDHLIRNTTYSTTEILGALTLLEIENRIFFQHNGYVLKS